MKEIEMRARVERLLDRAVRRAAVPASLGVALALTGCSDSVSTPAYMAQFPEGTSDAAIDHGQPQPDYMAQFPDASAVDATDDRGAVARYMAQMPDAADEQG